MTNLAEAKSDGAPLWDGKAKLRARMALPDEMALFAEGAVSAELAKTVHSPLRTFLAPSCSPQAGKPLCIRGVRHLVPVEVGRSVRPPYRTALAQFSLDGIDCTMGHRFLDLVAG